MLCKVQDKAPQGLQKVKNALKNGRCVELTKSEQSCVVEIKIIYQLSETIYRDNFPHFESGPQ